MSTATIPEDLAKAFEHYPPDEHVDETDMSVRAYVANMPEEKLAQYDPNWTDEEVVEWDGNFKCDGTLFLVCCERDVEVGEFRRIIELYQTFRKQNGL